MAALAHVGSVLQLDNVARLDPFGHLKRNWALACFNYVILTKYTIDVTLTSGEKLEFINSF